MLPVSQTKIINASIWDLLISNRRSGVKNVNQLNWAIAARRPSTQLNISFIVSDLKSILNDIKIKFQ